MLGALRRNKNSPIIIAVLGLVVLLMIGFGISFQGADQTAYAAKVNGEVISEAQFRARYASEYERRQQTDPKYDRIRAEEEDLRRQVLDQMITIRILAQKAREMGFAVDDQALRESILETPYFQVEGRFSREQYERVLMSLGTSDREYEESERERLLAEKLLSSLQTVGASERELWEAYALNARRIELEYVAVPKTAFGADVGNVTEADVEAWKAETEDVEAEVKAFYRAHKDERYDIPRRACASHVLVRYDESLPPDTKKQKRDEIAEAAEALKAGRSFADVVEAYSEDTQTVGGDLGCFAAGTAIPAVEEAAFALEPGQVSPIVESGFGLHIVKLRKFEAPVRRKLEDVRGEIERELAARDRVAAKARGLAKEILLAARTAAAAPDPAEAEADALPTDPASLEAAVAAVDSPVDLSVKTTGPLAASRSFVPGLTGNVDAFLTAAWLLPEDQSVPDQPVELDDAYIAFRVVDRIEPDESEFARRKDMMRQIQVPTKLNDVVPAWQKSLQEDARVVVNPRILSYDG
jgi:peptidyl-prolyl cis-trans isomerase D